MFEQAFKPYITEQKSSGEKDPIDASIAYHFQQVTNVRLTGIILTVRGHI